MRRGLGFVVGLAVWVGSFPLPSVAADSILTRRVQGQENAASSDVVINQIDTSAFPKVDIFVTVLKGGQPVTGLSNGDFRVKEDEVDQEPLTVAPKLSALNAVVTIDTSGSMKRALPQVQEAAKRFIDSLKGDDRITVISFAREVQMLSAAEAPNEAKAAIGATTARGDTALYDALYNSLGSLKGTAGRKAIVLLTDGVDDNGQGQQLSRHSLDDALKLARVINVPVYTIGLGPDRDPRVLSRIAQETGGKFFDAPQPADVAGLYESIGEQLLGQYHISYTSNLPGDGTAHRVAIAQGDSTGVKEYQSPQLGGVRKAPPRAETNLAPPASEPPSAVDQKLLAMNSAKLIVSVIPTVGAAPIENFTLLTVRRASGAFEDDKMVDNGSSGRPTYEQILPAGHYVLTARVEEGMAKQEVDLAAGEIKRVVIDANVGKLKVSCVPTPGGVPLTNCRVSLRRHATGAFDADSEHPIMQSLFKEVETLTVPAGRYTLRVDRGDATASKETEILAGQITSEAVALNAGELKVSLISRTGQPINGFQVTIRRSAPDGVSEPQVVVNGQGVYESSDKFTLNSGHYTLVVTKDQAQVQKEFDIQPGAGVNIEAQL